MHHGIASGFYRRHTAEAERTSRCSRAMMQVLPRPVSTPRPPGRHCAGPAASDRWWALKAPGPLGDICCGRPAAWRITLLVRLTSAACPRAPAGAPKAAHADRGRDAWRRLAAAVLPPHDRVGRPGPPWWPPGLSPLGRMPPIRRAHLRSPALTRHFRCPRWGWQRARLMGQQRSVARPRGYL